MDETERTITLANLEREQIVVQLPVYVGYVHQLRLFPRSVVIRLRNGEEIALPAPGPALASWQQSGWKLVPQDGVPWQIHENDLTGVRALFHYDDLVRWNRGIGYQVVPTCPAEGFAVNPPPDGGGLFFNQLTVVFKDGTSPARVEEINAEIGSTVMRAPTLSTAYRILLSPMVDLASAFEFYRRKADVQGVLPAINYMPFELIPNEGAQFNQTAVNLPAAWETIFNATGAVGSRKIRVAIVDNGVDMAHPDLYRNIAINQGEIPQTLDVVDTDGDGLISFVDLNDPANTDAAPPDANGNGYRDGADLLLDTRWLGNRDGDTEDGADDDRNGLVDDLVGWNFIENNENTMPVSVDQVHGTQMAGLIGAEANNGQFIAGSAWQVSIVPIRFTTTTGFGPSEAFFEAFTYAEEALGVDVVVVSSGWMASSENALDQNIRCADSVMCPDPSDPLARIPCGSIAHSRDKPQDDFDDSLASSVAAFQKAPLVEPQTGAIKSRALYVFAAGNSALNLADRNIVHVPGELMQTVLGGDRVLIVGAATRFIPAYFNEAYSNYGAPVVNLWAPGSYTTTSTDARSAMVQGTSFAGPVVGGAAALPVALDPSLAGDSELLGARLRVSAQPIVDVRRGSTAVAGCGDVVETAQPLLDANAALAP